MSTSEQPPTTTQATVPRQGGRRAARAAEAAGAAGRTSAGRHGTGGPGPSPTGPTPSRGPSGRATRRPSRRALAAVGAGAAVAAVAGAWFALGPGLGQTGPRSSASGLSLPDSIVGLQAASGSADFGEQPVWQAKATTATHGAAVVGRAYGSVKQRHTLRVVLARADLTGRLDLGWAADPGRAVGDARCTQDVKLTPGSPAAVRPTMMLCWHTGRSLSAYSVTIRFDRDPTAVEGAAAVDAALAAAR